jgi:hypothetical protein
VLEILQFSVGRSSCAVDFDSVRHYTKELGVSHLPTYTTDLVRLHTSTLRYVSLRSIASIDLNLVELVKSLKARRSGEEQRHC